MVESGRLDRIGKWRGMSSFANILTISCPVTFARASADTTWKHGWCYEVLYLIAAGKNLQYKYYSICEYSSIRARHS